MKRNIVAALAVMGCVYGTCEASVYFSESEETWKGSKGETCEKLPNLLSLYKAPALKSELDTLTAFSYAAGIESMSSLKSVIASLEGTLEETKKTLEETQKKHEEEIVSLKAELEKQKAALESEKQESSGMLSMFLNMWTSNLSQLSSLVAGMRYNPDCKSACDAFKETADRVSRELQ